jgi:hypothetical protein
VSRVETLANRVLSEPTCPGHEPRTMRLVGQRRHPLREIRSGDDATLARSGAGITEPLRLVSFGPFLKAFGTAICQGDIVSAKPSCNSGQLDVVSMSNFIRFFTNGQNMLQILLTPMILISRMCPSELIWMHHQSPHLYRGPW